MKYYSEICLVNKTISKESWRALFDIINTFEKPLASWHIFVSFSGAKIHYYLETHFKVPPSLRNLSDFMFVPSDKIPESASGISYPCFVVPPLNAADLCTYFLVEKNVEITTIELQFQKLTHRKATCFVHGKSRSYHLFTVDPATLLAIDFGSNHHIIMKSAPKYLESHKALGLFCENPSHAILRADVYPYNDSTNYLKQTDLDFDKHSLVLGASGSGKSKFISLLVDNLASDPNTKLHYRILVIDPHAALTNEIGALGQTIDFLTPHSSLDLFFESDDNVIISTELLLDIFQNLLAKNYNAKLERVLRHSLCLLLTGKNLSFRNLRKLLLEIDFRHQTLEQQKEKVPASVLEFFYGEFNEIKSRSYTDAIAPIISLIDELEMVPIFNSNNKSVNLTQALSENFLTILSLDRTKLGDRVTKIIAGLAMQQLLTLAEKNQLQQKIILVVDEVAVIENPILRRFLSESRKYNISVILAGQYFGGISPELRTAIFANTVNYYIFRIAKDDANLIVDNLDIKIPLDNTKDRKIKTLTSLEDRECIVRISAKAKLIPAFKCRTLDFIAKPGQPTSQQATPQVKTAKKAFRLSQKIATTCKVSLHDLLQQNSNAIYKRSSKSLQEILAQKIAQHNPKIKELS